MKDLKQITRYLSMLSLLFIGISCGESFDGGTASFDVLNASEASSEIIFIEDADESNINEETKARYREDAEKLAIRFVNNDNPDRTRIPRIMIQSFYNGMIHIFNSNNPKAREATREFSVHARTPSSSREIIVSADTTLPWIDSWRNGETFTGNTEVDELINKFAFTLIDYQEFPNTLPTASATLSSNDAINVYAVSALFEQIDDITTAGPDEVTDGSDITVLFFGNHLRYSFTYRYGDCPSGCTGSHTWIFKVFADGNVKFVETKGSLP